MKESNLRKKLSDGKKYLESLGLESGLIKLLSERFGMIALDEDTTAGIEEVVEFRKKLGELPAPQDNTLLAKILAAALRVDDMREKADELIDRFHTLISIVDIEAEYVDTTGIPLGAIVAVFMLAYICLWDGGCKVKIKNGHDSEKYFGSIYRGGASEHAVGFADGDFCLIETTELEGSDEIAARARELNAKNVICSTAKPSVDELPKNALHDAQELSQKLAAVGAKLVDSYIFLPNGVATLGLSPFGKELKYRFDHKSTTQKVRG